MSKPIHAATRSQLEILTGNVYRFVHGEIDRDALLYTAHASNEILIRDDSHYEEKDKLLKELFVGVYPLLNYLQATGEINEFFLTQVKDTVEALLELDKGAKETLLEPDNKMRGKNNESSNNKVDTVEWWIGPEVKDGQKSCRS